MTYFSPSRLTTASDTGAASPGSVMTEGAAAGFAAGSRLIAAELRPSIAAYYRFADYARNIARDSTLSPDDRRRRLERLDAVLSGADAAGDEPAQQLSAGLREDFLARSLPLEHARHLLQAYQADVAGRPCRSWSELLAYCRYAAAPMGRFVLDLHGEDRTAWPAAEALCSALALVGQIRNCQADRPLHLPQEWLTEAGVQPEDILAPRSTPGLRRVFARLLDGVDRLHEAAASLPRQIRNRGLRLEAACAFAMSRRLAARLRRGDPLAGRIELSRSDRICATFAAVRYAWRR